MSGALNWKKWRLYFFCKHFARFMSRYPFSGVELRGQAHPKHFDLSKIRVKFLEVGNGSFDTFVSY